MSSSRKDKEGTHQKGFTGGETAIFRIPPYHYLHILDHSTNVTRVEIGPKTYVTKDTEMVVLGPKQMVVVPPCHYCVIKNPVARDDKGEILSDPLGQIKLRHADLDVRLEQEPFPLYPGEILHQDVTKLTVVPANCALRLKANRDFMDGTTKRLADEEWLFEGPGTYVPRKECEVVEKIKAMVIQPNHALKLRAKVETKDRDGKPRVVGEEWLVRKVGAYLPGAYEEVLETVKAYVLTEKRALHVKAIRSFTDEWGKERKNGDEWLVTLEDTETYIPGVDVKVESEVPIVTLSNRQYCVVLDPHDATTGKPQFGQKKLIKGEKSFFLKPGETLEDGIRDIFVLSENEGLILKAKEAFTDTSVTPAIQRKPGDRWMIRGPTEFIPPISTELVTKRYAIPLDDNEGIYVRDIKTGKVRAVCGSTYMLNQDEELWNKELPPTVESLLEKNALADRSIRPKPGPSDKTFGGHPLQKGVPEEGLPHVRDKTRVVTYRVPHNGAVQLYDFKEKKSRVIFGPELVMLQPDEQFSELSLSGGRPKKPNEIRALCLLLGPDFCTDRVTVETADHARLQLQLAYNWHFDVDKKNQEQARSLFSVPDFVGDMCKAIASRIRGAVASVNFDDFHKNSARIIRESVFGFDESRKPRYFIKFSQNNLVITSVDIQSVEPVDQRTRDALQKSVQLAIEITTSSQEATARHEAERAEQEAKGRLSRQKIEDEVKAEKSRLALLDLQAQAMEVESCGQSKAESLGKAAAQKIEGEAAVEQAQLKAKATSIKEESDLEMLTKAREAELSYVKAQDELEVNKARELGDIEAKKFKDLVDAIGQNTIQAIAMAGPELQVKLLQGLGLQSTLITDGKTPLNLFSTALGFLGQKPTPQPRVPLAQTSTPVALDHECDTA